MSGPFTSPVASSVPFDPTVKELLIAENVQDAIDELTAKQNVLRLALTNTYNSTWTNNGFLGRNELTPNTPIVFGRNMTINELTFINQSTNKNFFLDLYKNGRSAGNLIGTLTVNTTTNIFQVFQGLNFTFVAGDSLSYRYRNISGTSPSDSSIEIYCTITG